MQAYLCMYIYIYIYVYYADMYIMLHIHPIKHVTKYNHETYSTMKHIQLYHGTIGLCTLIYIYIISIYIYIIRCIYIYIHCM